MGSWQGQSVCGGVGSVPTASRWLCWGLRSHISEITTWDSAGPSSSNSSPQATIKVTFPIE
jgi:hypothetical protein